MFYEHPLSYSSLCFKTCLGLAHIIVRRNAKPFVVKSSRFLIVCMYRAPHGECPIESMMKYSWGLELELLLSLGQLYTGT